MHLLCKRPICSAEVIGIRFDTNPVESTSNSIISTAECSNQNRLFDADCTVSQNYESSTEIVLETQTGKIKSIERSYES